MENDNNELQTTIEKHLEGEKKLGCSSQTSQQLNKYICMRSKTMINSFTIHVTLNSKFPL